VNYFEVASRSNWQIDKQIANYIEQGIYSGLFLPGSALPSERKLAEELQVNRSTVISAYDELQSIRLINKKRGSYTRISTDIWRLEQKRVPNWSTYLENGSFFPNLPLVQRKIQEEIMNNDLINMASAELSQELLPYEEFSKILSFQPFTEQLGYGHPNGNEALRETIWN
jgi:GntR family transcriptional regulator of abcA and norABC